MTPTQWVKYGLSGFFALVLLMMAGCPVYNVWSAEMSGRAAFAKAEQDRMILVEEGRARLQYEEFMAQAEVVRAEGMASAMKIENGQLNETYNQYLFIRQLGEMAERGSVPQFFYIPSSGMLPTFDLKQGIKRDSL